MHLSSGQLLLYFQNIYGIAHLKAVGRVAQSVQRLARGWTVWGSNPGGGEIFRNCPDQPWGPTSLLYNGYRAFSGGKERPGRDADPSPPSSAVVKKGCSYTSTPPMGRTACTEPQCLYKGALYLYITFVLHSNFKALQVYSESEYHKPYELFETQSETIDTREVNN
jgi:hypothetical protein